MTTGRSMAGKMSTFMRRNDTTPSTRSRIAITATVSGRRSARRTIHIGADHPTGVCTGRRSHADGMLWPPSVTRDREQRHGLVEPLEHPLARRVEAEGVAPGLR